MPAIYYTLHKLFKFNKLTSQEYIILALFILAVIFAIYSINLKY